MNMTSIPVSIILMVLTAYLCIYIYRQDKIEKEPISLLALLFAAGMVSFLLAAVLENLLVGGVDTLFAPYITFDGEGLKSYASDGIRIAHILSCTAVLAVIEECVRGLALCLLTHKNQNFNYTFDGIVYAVVLYLGFGIVEAFRYVQSGGFGSVLLRALYCIPAHLFLGVLMGCFYTGWQKKSLQKKHLAPYFVIVPALVHTAYSFLNQYSVVKGGYLYEIVTVLLGVIGVLIIRKKASADTAIALLLCITLSAGLLQPMHANADGMLVLNKESLSKYKGVYYDQLDLNGLCVYNNMKEMIPAGDLSGEFEIAAPVMNWDTIWKAVHAFHLENPKYYWMDAGASNVSYREKQLDTSRVFMNITFTTYDYWPQTLDKKVEQEKLNKAVKSIAAEAKKKEKKIQQIEYVHNYLANNCVYDYDKLHNCEKTIHDPFDELIYSAYGCLVQKHAVCAGYAKAFELIMQELGITCNYVKGFAGDPGSMGRHGWNYVELEGETYWVDVTWDDYDLEGKDNDAVHTYCMQTTKAMEKDHHAEDTYTNLTQPVATGTKFNYHNYHKYTLKEYSGSKMAEILKKQKSAMKEVHFTSKDAYKKALKAVQDGKFNSKTFGGNFWYWEDPYYNNLIFAKR